MDAITIIVTLALIAGALILVLYPLWRQTHTQAAAGRAGQTREEYQVRYQASLAAIKDLMFDYEMGKITEADYQYLLAKAKVEAAQIRKQLDALNDGEVVVDPTLEAHIEALVAQVRESRLNANGNESLLAEVEADIERLKNIGADGALACPGCGRAFEIGDVFCAGCGHALEDMKANAADDEDACPQCGYALRPDDAFCARCGAKVGNAAPLAEASI